MNFNKSLTLVAISASLALTTSVSASTLADHSSKAVSISEDDGSEIIITPFALLYADYAVFASTGVYTTTTFATPSNNSKNINVNFRNTGAANATVTLYRKGLFSDTPVDSLTVASGKELYKTMPGASSTTYYVKIVGYNGATVKGELRVNQQD